MNKMNIFQIDDTIREKWQMVNEIVEAADGEVTAEAMAIIDEINELDVARDKKIEGAACIYKETDGLIEAIDKEIKRLQAEKKRAVQQQERLKEYLRYATEGENFKSLNAQVNWRKTTSVVVDDINLLPAEYIVFKAPEANKNEIKAALKVGANIAGAHLEENRSISIR